MLAASGMPLTVNLPVRRRAQRPRPAPSLPAADAALVRLLGELSAHQKDTRPFEIVAPHAWDAVAQDNAAIEALLARIVATPAQGQAGIRAKALALRGLLDDDGQLYADASAPDRLAWSLVQDLLAE